MELTLVDTTAMPVVSSISIIYSLSHRCIMINLEHASINPSDIDPEASHQRHHHIPRKMLPIRYHGIVTGWHET